LQVLNDRLIKAPGAAQSDTVRGGAIFPNTMAWQLHRAAQTCRLGGGPRSRQVLRANTQPLEQE